MICSVYLKRKDSDHLGMCFNVGIRKGLERPAYSSVSPASVYSA